MNETPTLEFKQSFSRSFLKTVSAFANYSGGTVLFGVNDEGEVVGVKDAKELCLRIENAINDTLEPIPEYTLHPKVYEGKTVVQLTVREGLDKPYLSGGRAYRRAHTSTVPVDRSQLRRLALLGEGLSFDELPSTSQDLSFSVLNEQLKETLGLVVINEDTYRTLGLYTSKTGFTNAASILADKNSMPGIDLVRFGATINEILDRELVEGVSALTQFERAMDFYQRYCVVERIEGALRESFELVPKTSFREAVANALVHRRWDVRAAVRVAVHDALVEVTSAGGLPEDVSEKQYLSGNLSILRNQNVGSVFFRLGLIERLGTGVRRIQAGYQGSLVQPSFEVTESSITVRLPMIELAEEVGANEKAVLEILRREGPASRPDIAQSVGMSQSKVGRILRDLLARGLVRTSGAARATRYYL